MPSSLDGFGPSVRRVQDALAAAGGGHTVVALDQPARTSAEAARAVGCRVDQIAKSLVFRGAESQRAVLVIASGANRVDERKVAGLIAEPVGRADADFVRARTGFAIGGVAPIGLPAPIPMVLDVSLKRFPAVYAAAGHPHCVFATSVEELKRLTGCLVSYAIAEKI